MFLFSIMITLTCTCTFAWGDDYSYPVVSYKFLKDEISFRGSEISSRRNDISHRFAATKFRFVEAKLRSNDTKFRLTGTKFRLMPLNFVSINLLALRNFADIRTIEAPKFRRFFVWSESSQFALIAEIRVISLISANFVCISFAQYCICEKEITELVLGIIVSRFKTPT